MKRLAPRSLLGQFVLLHSVVAILATVTLLASASALLHGTADHFQRTLLRDEAALVQAALARGDAPATRSNGMAVALLDAGRRERAVSGPRRPAVLATAPLADQPQFFRRGSIEGYSVPLRSSGWIIISQDDTDPQVVTDDIVRSFLKRFALILLPIAALVPLIGALLARRLTLRMRAVSRAAETIGPQSPQQRLPLDLLPAEVAPLARATNAALDRLAAALAVQAAFAADVAHELRNPLAAIRLRADAIGEPAARTQLLASVDRAARVIAQLLALAELERPIGQEAMPVDLATLAQSVVADRAPAIFAGGRTIAFEAQGQATAVGHAEALTLALENLVDNAARHTGPGTAIVVQAGPGARVAVVDDGEGVADAHLARLTDRLWRGDAARTEGTGIGLSIVDRIANAHGGTLTVQAGPGGRGLTFTIGLVPDPEPSE